MLCADPHRRGGDEEEQESVVADERRLGVLVEAEVEADVLEAGDGGGGRWNTCN